MLTFEKQEKEKDPSRRPAEADATGVHSAPPHVRPPADNVWPGVTVELVDRTDNQTEFPPYGA